MKTYYLNVEGRAVGPYTLNQLRTMWLAGSITVNSEFAEPDKSWESAQTLGLDAQVGGGGAMAAASIFGVAGAIAGIILALFGFLLFFGARNAMNESTAAIMLVGGAVLAQVSILGLAIVAKR
jgi:uncharacterized membrane protein